MLHLILLLNKLFLFCSTFLKLKGDPQLNLWKVSTLKHSKQQDSDSCGVFCLMVSIFCLQKKFLSVFSIWKPILTFVTHNHSSQAPDEKVLRTYPPCLGEITTSIFWSFYWNHDIENDFCLECNLFVLEISQMQTH